MRSTEARLLILRTGVGGTGGIFSFEFGLGLAKGSCTGLVGRLWLNEKGDRRALRLRIVGEGEMIAAIGGLVEVVDLARALLLDLSLPLKMFCARVRESEDECLADAELSVRYSLPGGGASSPPLPLRFLL